MPLYAVELLPSAARQLTRLDRLVQRRIARTIDRLAFEPRGPTSTKLRGADDVWRARVRDLRVLYQVFDDRLLILVVAASPGGADS